MNRKKEIIEISGMHCTSCEKRIENELKKLSGVINVMASYEKGNAAVEFDADACSIDTIKNTIKSAGYEPEKKSGFGLLAILLVGAAIMYLSKNTGTFNMSSKLQSDVTYLVLFIVGIFTSIHCIGMCGGIMLSQSISKDKEVSKFSALKPAMLYNAGRILAYTVLGGIVGGLGSVLSISLRVKAGIAIFAGIFMIMMGFNMSGFKFFRKLHIKLPWSFCSIKGKSRTPFIVGLLNGLMPCGPLQTMQLYALGTGSALKGALSMLVFAVGTVPLMLIFGGVAGFISKGYTKKILQLSGILVIVLGFIMTNRGLAMSGVNISPMSLLRGSNTVQLSKSNPGAKAELKDGVQILNMSATYRGYSPNVLFVQKGVPVKWVIEGKEITSCNNQIIIPSLNIQQDLRSGENIINFTPEETGDINFSCWMGMIRGVIKVVDKLDGFDTSSVPAEDIPSQAPSCCSGGAPAGGTVNNKPSIYGNDISKVPTERLVKKADILNNKQAITVKGIGYELNPLIIVLNKGYETQINLDLSQFDSPEGKFEVIDKNQNVIAEIDGKSGSNIIKYKFTSPGVYAFTKDNGNIMGLIEVVDDITKANVEAIRQKYIQ